MIPRSIFWLTGFLACALNAGALPPMNEKLRAAWWESHADAASWPAEAERIHQGLLKVQSEKGLRSAMSQPGMTAWIAHLYWLSLFPEDYARDAYWSVEEHRRTFAALSQEKVLPRLLLFSLRDGDDAGSALRVLNRIYQAQPAAARAFPKLAVAYAVVFDQPIPEHWPHPFVQRSSVPVGDLEPERRFAFYLESLKQKQLLYDPGTLSVQELTYVVDSFIRLEELRKAQKIQISSIKKLPRVYHAVKYDWSRIQQARYVWPESVYGLSDIARSGGICADQAYFVTQTAKARGVPVIAFLGQGRSGDHAWIGYLEKPGHWELDFARYKGQDYPSGSAWDPQTLRRITDADVVFLNEDLTRKTGYGKARPLLIWAALNQERDFYRSLVRMARGHIPTSPETWEMEAEWLARTPATPRGQAAFWKAWAANFRKVPSYRFRGQRMLLQVYRAAGESKSAERLEAEIIKENRNKRFDLGIQLAADGIFDLQQRQRWDEAHRELEGAMRRFRSKAGGHLFYDLLQPYVLNCLDARQYPHARDALDQLGKGFQVMKKSILANDIRELKRQVESLGK